MWASLIYVDKCLNASKTVMSAKRQNTRSKVRCVHTQLVVVLRAKTACAQFREHHAGMLEGIEDLQLLNAAAHGRSVCADNAQGLLEQPGLVLWRRSCNVRTNNDGQGWGGRYGSRVARDGACCRPLREGAVRTGAHWHGWGRGGVRNWVGSWNDGVSRKWD